MNKKLAKFALVIVALMLLSTLVSLNKISAVTYYNYNFAGPYYYDGSIPNSNQTAVVSLLWVNGTRYDFNLTVTALGVSVSTKNVTSTSPVYQALWNSSSSLSLYSDIDFQPLNATQNVNIYIPASSSVAFNYTFTITDYAGMTHAYLEAGLSTNGVTVNLLQQSDLNNGAGTATFVLAQYGTYTLTFLCDQGSYSQQFTAKGILSNSLLVPATAFPATNLTYTTVNAERVNSSEIAIVYVDPTVSTQWATFLIYHPVGTVNIIDYYLNQTGNSQTVTWNGADPQVSYIVNVTALLTNVTSGYGFMPSWTFSIGTLPPANPFLGVFDWLGQYVNTMPYTPTGWTGANGQQISSGMIAEFVGMAIILMFLGVGSYRSSGITCIVTWIMSGILIWLGWWSNGVTGGLAAVPSFAICGFIAIFIQIGEGKQVEREV